MSEEKTEKGIHAKSASLWGQIIAAVWIAGWSAFKFIKHIETAEVEHFIFSGLAIAACFTPVYFNLIMDKIKDIKLGGRE